MNATTQRKSTASALACAGLLALGATAGLAPSSARALDCGANNGFVCQGSASQYAGGFNPGVGSGGFGGGACTATRTPCCRPSSTR